MKILLLSYRGNPYSGGQGIYLYYLARELVRQGHQVQVVVGPPYPDSLDGIPVYQIPNLNFLGRKKEFLPPGNPFPRALFSIQGGTPSTERGDIT